MAAASGAPAQPDRAANVRLLAWLTLGQTAASTVFLIGFVRFLDLAAAPTVVRLEAATGAVALAWLATLIAALPALALARAAPRRATLFVFAILQALLAAYLLFDMELFAQTRLHLSRPVLLTVLQPHALQTIGIGTGTLLRLGVSLVAVFAIELVAVFAVASRLSGPLPRARAWMVALALLTAGDRVAYSVLAAGWVEPRFDLGRASPLPEWLSPTIPEEIAVNELGLRDVYRRRSAAGWRARPGSSMRYPAPEAAAWAPRAPGKLNVIVLAIESLRADQVDAATMPNLAALAARSRDYRLHFSASNCTHVSLFSLLYGLSPRLWTPISDAGVRPFTYELLRRLGYDLSITSSNTMSWFGIDKLAFPAELALRFDPSGDPDDGATAALIHEIRRAHERPYFAFLFLNSSHFPYRVPAHDVLFQPYLAEIDPSRSDLQSHRAEVVNRYKNALHHIDALLGELLRAVDDSGQGERTMIVITGDHGESFWEDGRLSHTSLLSTWQLHVPLVVHVPGAPPERIEQLSGHDDVMPMIFAALGADLPAQSYADGSPSTLGTPRLAAQCSPEELSQFAIIDAQALVRFDQTERYLRTTEAESLDGKLLSGASEHQALQRALPEILESARATARWWPGQ